MKDIIRKRFEESISVIHQTGQRLTDAIAAAAEMIVAAYRNGGGVFLFGNGGSAADAQHIAAELVGRFLKERKALKAEALSTNSSVLTCLANDYSYQAIFARQLEANATARDLAIGLSTSGNSSNVVAGLAKAREMGMKTIAFTGNGGGKCAALVDVLLDVAGPGLPSPRIQEAHAVIYHVLCELVESAMAQKR